MDKQLLKAYIRTIVEEEVKKILPEMLAEAVAEVKKINKINESTATATPNKPKVDRKRLAELMGIDYDRDSGTVRATTEGLSSAGTLTALDAAGNRVQVPESSVAPEVRAALTRDYSAVLKAMKIV